MNRGWKGRIGVIYPADGLIDDEFYKFVPDGVAIHLTRISVPDEKLSIKVVAAVAETAEIEHAARILKITRPNVIAYACTSGSFLKSGYEKEISRRMQNAAGVLSFTTTEAVVEALNFFGVRRLSVVAPYPDEINFYLKRYLEQSGFIVSRLQGLNLATEWDIGNFQPTELYRYAVDAARKDSDALYIPCTGFRTAEIIEPLEEDLGKPVITANQATMWKALKLAEIREPVNGVGELLRQRR